VALAYYQGLSHAEVASHLVQPLGTVKSWVRRALLALKDCLGQAQHLCEPVRSGGGR
jgi:RNA polymerase sigma-70 factor (ECF subfamily)